MTWNQAEKDVKGFQKLEKIIPNVQDYDLIAFASQECKKSNRLERVGEIEKFMVPKSFVNIDKASQMTWMHEMYLTIFIRRELATDVSKVNQTFLARGFGGFVGNKGGIAYSLKIKNRLFNFIACHLRHGQDKVLERNKMAQELITEMKMQEL